MNNTASFAAQFRVFGTTRLEWVLGNLEFFIKEVTCSPEDIYLRVILIATVTLLTFNISPGWLEKLSLQSLPAPAVDPDDMGTLIQLPGKIDGWLEPQPMGIYDFVFLSF